MYPGSHFLTDVRGCAMKLESINAACTGRTGFWHCCPYPANPVTVTMQHAQGTQALGT